MLEPGYQGQRSVEGTLFSSGLKRNWTELLPDSMLVHFLTKHSGHLARRGRLSSIFERQGRWRNGDGDLMKTASN
jgi:hypothetical protein